jgi:hypothetical protein
LLEELDLFSLTNAQNAERRILNKIRKQFHPINNRNSQFAKFTKFNNNNNNNYYYDNNTNNYNNNNNNNNSNYNRNESSQDSERGEKLDGTTPYNNRELLKCHDCGSVSRHRAHECKRNNFNYRKTYNAKATNDDDKQKSKDKSNTKTKRDEISSNDENFN